jgi:hypothetical protein
MSSGVSTEERDFAAFRLGEGIEASGIELHVFDGGLRGVRACTPIISGDLLLSVPETALIGLVSSKRDQTLQAATARCGKPKLTERCLLAAHLLIQKSTPSSKWTAYIAMLPDQYPILGCFPPDVTNELQVSCLADQAQKNCMHLLL